MLEVAGGRRAKDTNILVIGDIGLLMDREKKIGNSRGDRRLLVYGE